VWGKRRRKPKKHTLNVFRSSLGKKQQKGRNFLKNFGATAHGFGFVVVFCFVNFGRIAMTLASGVESTRVLGTESREPGSIPLFSGWLSVKTYVRPSGLSIQIIIDRRGIDENLAHGVYRRVNQIFSKNKSNSSAIQYINLVANTSDFSQMGA